MGELRCVHSFYPVVLRFSVRVSDESGETVAVCDTSCELGERRKEAKGEGERPAPRQLNLRRKWHLSRYRKARKTITWIPGSRRRDMILQSDPINNAMPHREGEVARVLQTGKLDCVRFNKIY